MKQVDQPVKELVLIVSCNTLDKVACVDFKRGFAFIDWIEFSCQRTKTSDKDEVYEVAHVCGDEDIAASGRSIPNLSISNQWPRKGKESLGCTIWPIVCSGVVSFSISPISWDEMPIKSAQWLEPDENLRPINVREPNENTYRGNQTCNHFRPR